MKKVIKYLWRTFFIGLGLFILLVLLAGWGVFGRMPSIEELQNPTASLASQVYADDGTIMGKYYFEEDRLNVKYKDISPYIVKALVSTEDKRFYEHSGIDGHRVFTAMLALGTHGGASTITMQTAKNLFTDNWGTKNFILRSIQKIKEAIIAVKLERNFTKDEIVALYLNTIEFSDHVYGVRNASKTFFQTEPDRVNLQQAAMLIGMINAPGLYNPRRNPRQALEKRNTVINLMANANFITKQTADSIKRIPNDVSKYKKLDETAGLAPYFRMVLGEEMKKWCREHKKSDGSSYDLYRDGLKIYTTVNPRMQTYAEEAVAKHMAYMQKMLNQQENIKSGSVWKKYANVLEVAMKQSERWRSAKKDGMSAEDIRKTFFVKTPMKIFAWNSARSTDTVMTPYDSLKYCHQMLQAGFMAMDPLSGEVKAWVGGIDFKTFRFDHVNINTRRQVGSTIKPLLYSLAIEKGGFTPDRMVVDEQQNFTGYGNVPATTTTCTGETIPMSEALALSRNCATAYIMKQLGDGDKSAHKLIDFLKFCNVTAPIQPYPSIAIGSSEISLFEMMQAYSMFPGRGYNVKPMYITRIEDKNGNTLQTNVPQRREVISDATAFSVINMMQDVMQFGTGRRIWSYDGIDGEIAGKTGTTNDNSDAWFMGYTPQLLCGVWTGCDDRFIRFNSTDVGQGSSLALPIWAYFYGKASKDKNLALDTRSVFVRPDVINTDFNHDWKNSVPEHLGAEGQDVGNGSADQYADTLPGNVKPQDLPGESENPQTPPKPGTPPQPKAILPKKPGTQR